MIFEIYEDHEGEWRWRLLAANGRIMADSGEGYVDHAGCTRAIETLHRELKAADSISIRNAKKHAKPTPAKPAKR